MMKRLIGFFLVCSISLAVLFTTMESNEKVSDVMQANVEALASDESGGQPMDCYSKVWDAGDGRPVETKTYCGDCQPIKCTDWYNKYVVCDD